MNPKCHACGIPELSAELSGQQHDFWNNLPVPPISGGGYMKKQSLQKYLKILFLVEQTPSRFFKEDDSETGPSRANRILLPIHSCIHYFSDFFI